MLFVYEALPLQEIELTENQFYIGTTATANTSYQQPATTLTVDQDTVQSPGFRRALVRLSGSSAPTLPATCTQKADSASNLVVQQSMS